jgi:hypothetical protein
MRFPRRCGNGQVFEVSRPVGITREQLKPFEQLKQLDPLRCNVPLVSDRDESV